MMADHEGIHWCNLFSSWFGFLPAVAGFQVAILATINDFPLVFLFVLGLVRFDCAGFANN